MKRIIGTILLCISITAFCAAQDQIGQNDSFRQEGVASYYGREFAGRPTASGEIFDPAQLTAAHPTLPFGTLLRVTNRNNNSQVIVRVNDRGPFVAARILDVSQGAAEILDMIGTGTAPILLEVVDSSALSEAQTTPPQAAPTPAAPQPAPAQPVPQAEPILAAAPPPERSPEPPPAREPILAPTVPQPPAMIIPGMPPLGTNKSYRLQVGSFLVPRNAADAFDKLKSAGLNPAYERNGEYYRVVLAGIRAEDIQALAIKIGEAGFREVLVREER